MATRYWVGGSGNWDGTTTTHWSATSGGAGGASAPTSADDVVFDANSNTGTSAFTVTITGTSAAPSNCANFSTSGLDGAMTLTMGATAQLNCYASMTIPATNFVFSGTAGGAILFSSTSTGNTLTTNGIALSNVTLIFNGVGGGWTLGSALTTGSIYTNYGTFNTGNFNITSGSIIRNASVSACTVNLGSSTITLSGTSSITMLATNLTFNAGTSTINCSNASPTFAGAGLTFNNVGFTATTGGGITITGANTFNNFSITNLSASNRKLFTFGANQTINGTLTLNSSNIATRRLQLVSDIVGTQRTITLNGTLATMTDCDFRDIATAGTAGTWTGTRIGNGLNNSGITFDAAKTVYWNLAAGGNWAATAWATSSGGTPAANNFPLAQDTAIIQNTGLNTSATITYDVAWMMGTLDSSTRSNAFTLTIAATVTPNVYGNLTLSSATTIALGGATGFILYGYGITQTITSNSASNASPLSISSVGGTCTFADNFTTSAAIILNNGTLNLNNNTISCFNFNSANTNTRAIAFGTGNITVTGSNATIWAMSTATGFTYTGTPTVNFTYSGSTGTRTVQHGGTGVTETNAISIYVTAGSDSFVNSGGCKNLDFTGFSGTLTTSARTIYGNLKIPNTIVSITNTGQWLLGATSGTQQITTSGNLLDFPIAQNGPGGTVQLQDDLIMGSTRTLTLTAGTLDLNNKNVSTGLFNSSNSNTRSLLMGSGTFTLTGTGTIWAFGVVTGMTLVPSTSTIVFNGSGIGTFNGGGLTFNNLTQSSSNALTISSSNTFNTISNTVSPTTITFGTSTNTTVTNFNIYGTPGNLVTINSSSAGTRAILSDLSGTVNVSFTSIKDSNATGGAIWNAFTSNGNVDAGNNIGWNFTSTSTPTSMLILF